MTDVKSNIKIQPLSTNDFPSIIKVWRASVCATHHFFTLEEIEFYQPLILKYTLPQLALYGIKENNILCGFIALSEKKIEMLFISPDKFKQGYGSKLLSFAIKKGCTLIDVNEENPNALKFYKHQGFSVISRDEFDDCGKPHPILHMRLK